MTTCCPGGRPFGSSCRLCCRTTRCSMLAHFCHERAIVRGCMHVRPTQPHRTQFPPSCTSLPSNRFQSQHIRDASDTYVDTAKHGRQYGSDFVLSIVVTSGDKIVVVVVAVRRSLSSSSSSSSSSLLVVGEWRQIVSLLTVK